MTNLRKTDLNEMKQDAVRRSREMQQKARRQHHFENLPAKCEVKKEECKPIVYKSKKSKGLFSKLKLDAETLLILAIIIVLINEKADMPLIVALLYLLL